MTKHTSGDAPYIVAEDIELLLRRWAESSGFGTPDQEFFELLRAEFKKELHTIFPRVEIVPEAALREGLTKLAVLHKGPLVSLEKVYVPDPAVSLEVTRLVGEDLKPLGEKSRSPESLKRQIQRISERFGGKLKHSVAVIDDAIMSGNTLVEVIRLFREFGVFVTEAIGGVVIGRAEERLKEMFPHLKVLSVARYDEVIGEVQHERDFYAGVPFSGRLLGKRDIPFNPEIGAPYFLPFGRPHEWGGIPEEHALQWSKFCLGQSVRLWREVERRSGRKVYSRDIPRLLPGFPVGEELVCENLEKLLEGM